MGDAYNLSTSTAALVTHATTACSATSYGVDWRLPGQALTIIGIALAAAGATVSSVAFVVVVSTRMPNRALRLGLLSLSAADLLFALTTIAQLSFVYYWVFDGSGGHKCGVGGGEFGQEAAAAAERDEQRHRREWCAEKMLERLWDIATTANQVTLVFLASQQFLVIRWPLHYRDGLPAGSCCIALVLAWVGSVVVGLAPTAIVALSTSDHPAIDSWPSKGTTRFCYQLLLYDHKRSDSCGRKHALPFGQDAHQRATVIFDAALTCTALLLLGISYGYLVVVVRRTVNDSCRSNGSNLEANVPLATLPEPTRGELCPEQSKQKPLQKHRIERQQQQQHLLLHEREQRPAPSHRHSARRAIVVTAVVTAACTVCYLPLHVVKFLTNFYKDGDCNGCRHPIVYPSLLILACSAPLADPLIYTLRLKPLRDSAQRLFARCFCRPCDSVRAQRAAFATVAAAAVHRSPICTRLPAAVNH